MWLGIMRKKGVVHKVRPVHRLDRDTSGCILFGKTKEAQQYYTDELQAGRIDRIYTGLVEGCINEDGVVDDLLVLTQYLIIAVSSMNLVNRLKRNIPFLVTKVNIRY